MKVAAAIKRLDAAARKFGGHVENDSAGRWVTLQVCAPVGKWWGATDGPHLCVTTCRGPQAWLDEAVEDGLERIAYGVQDIPEDEVGE